MKRLLLTASAVALVAVAGTAQARDQISIVGSSTVFPYTQAVAEQFASMTGAPSPVVESTGTGGGGRPVLCLPAVASQFWTCAPEPVTWRLPTVRRPAGECRSLAPISVMRCFS